MKGWQFMLGVLPTVIVVGIIAEEVKQWFIDWPYIWVHLPVLTLVAMCWMPFLDKFGTHKKYSFSQKVTVLLIGAVAMAMYYRADTVGEFLLIALSMSVIFLSGTAYRRHVDRAAADSRDFIL